MKTIAYFTGLFMCIAGGYFVKNITGDVIPEGALVVILCVGGGTLVGFFSRNVWEDK